MSFLYNNKYTVCQIVTNQTQNATFMLDSNLIKKEKWRKKKASRTAFFVVSTIHNKNVGKYIKIRRPDVVRLSTEGNPMINIKKWSHFLNVYFEVWFRGLWRKVWCCHVILVVGCKYIISLSFDEHTYLQILREKENRNLNWKFMLFHTIKPARIVTMNSHEIFWPVDLVRRQTRIVDRQHLSIYMSWYTSIRKWLKCHKGQQLEQTVVSSYVLSLTLRLGILWGS